LHNNKKSKMKIVIDNQKFDYDTGCRLLKLKHETCPFEQLNDVWDAIEPLTFKEIAAFQNLEERRVGILCLGLERLTKEVNPKLLSKKRMKKSTIWVDEAGNLVTHKFNDTYELYEVDGAYFSEGLKDWQKAENSYFVKCKDTSTDRDYFIWVDLLSVYKTNKNPKRNSTFDVAKISPIAAIAWTIQTNISKGNIEKLIRQGDCVLIKPKNKDITVDARHLTEKEYRTLLVAES
jgi:hypothetical protein